QRRPEARAARVPVERACDPAVRAVRLRTRGVPQGALPAGRGGRGRDPDGVPRRPVIDLELLLDVVRGEATGIGSSIHGEQHWKAVARAGLDIAARTPGADPTVVFLF